ncbi:MAG TPA: hypothetical protein VE998_06340 [Terriglobales bacterium]|nr:hypothetical protein [Terriglobales bacterium]
MTKRIVCASPDVQNVTAEQIRKIAAMAARAPSGDNTQPWSFVWDGSVLTVLFDSNRARHVLDAGLSGSKISLGCVAESAAIAASQFGFATRCEYLLGTSAPERPCPAARISFHYHARPPDPLLDAIEKRTTDRRIFHKGSLPVGELAQIWADFDRRESIGVHFAESLAPDLFNFLVAAESLVTRHPAIFPDTLPWIRMTERELACTQDGMPWRGTGVRPFEYPVLRLVRAMPALFPLFSRAGMARSYKARLRKLLRSSAGLFCVSARGDAADTLTEAGRLSMRLWLRLAQLGYGVHPLTLSSLCLYNFKAGVLDAESVRLFGAGYAKGEGVLRKAFSIPDKNVLVWMFRTGISSALPPGWITPRKMLENMLQVAVASVH